MRCRRCGKTIGVSNRNHNKDKQECARCHYLGQICAYPGVQKNPNRSQIGRYKSGLKWCRTCQEWRQVEGFRCDICNKLIRTVPERGQFRREYKPVVRY